MRLPGAQHTSREVFKSGLLLFVPYMRILVACEESQTVTKAFRALGHEAFSCDIQECSGGHPEWHYQQDVFEVIDMGWDMMIAFPPCTHLAVSGARHFPAKIADGRQQAALDFVRALMDADIPKIAIENPVSVISSKIRKPDQIIQPWMFGHGETKATCLWLKGLPKLRPTNIVEGREQRIHRLPPSPDRAKLRSKTFQGIANALADQYSRFVECGISVDEWNDLIEIPRRKKIYPQPGLKVNRLTIISFSHSDKRGRKFFNAKCDCGSDCILMGSAIISGNTKSCGCLSREVRGKNRISNNHSEITAIILGYKRHAIDRGLKWELNRSDVEAVIKGNCWYCGSPPNNVKKTKNSIGEGLLYSGIDRIDSNKDYTIENIAPCCKICNMAKGKLSIADFEKWAINIGKRAMAQQWGAKKQTVRRAAPWE